MTTQGSPNAPAPLSATHKITRAVRLTVLGASLASLSALALTPAVGYAQNQAVYQIAPARWAAP